MTIDGAGQPPRKILLENYSHCDTMPAMRTASIELFKKLAVI